MHVRYKSRIPSLVEQPISVTTFRGISSSAGDLQLGCGWKAGIGGGPNWNYGHVCQSIKPRYSRSNRGNSYL